MRYSLTRSKTKVPLLGEDPDFRKGIGRKTSAREGLKKVGGLRNSVRV